MHFLRSSWALGEVDAVRAEAVGTLLWDSAVHGVVASLAAAYAQRALIAGAQRVASQAYVALLSAVGFLDEPCWLAAEEAPILLDWPEKKI